MSRIGTFIVSTTSTNVLIADLGLELVHPSTSDLFDGFTEFEINNSADLASAIELGLLTTPAIAIPQDYVLEERLSNATDIITTNISQQYFQWATYRSSLKNSYKVLKTLGGDTDDYPFIVPANCVLWQIKSNLEPVWLRLYKNFGLYKQFLLTDWPHQNISFAENDVVYVYAKKLNNTQNIWFQGSSSGSSSGTDNSSGKATVTFYFRTT